MSNYHLSKPWLSKGLLKSIRTKNKLYRQYLTNQSSHYEIRYKNDKNKLNHSLTIAKRIYYEKIIDASKSNAKATWRVLNEIIKKKKKAFCQSVFFDPVTPNELSEISNSFRPGKAAGHDRIPISIIKQSIQIIADTLAHIINLSITHGIPLFKAGD